MDDSGVIFQDLELESYPVLEALSPKAQFMVDFLDLPRATSIEDAKWELFQLEFLSYNHKISADTKSRQIAWSWTAAADAVVDSILYPNTPHVFVSINQEESKEKIRYARDIIMALDEEVRPTIVRESLLELEIENGSRLISFPSKPARGKARTRIYLDEMAHYARDKDQAIYAASLPATIKGDGYVRIGSSPLGANGMFWELITDRRRFPDVVTRSLPWWAIQAFSHNVWEAIREAPHMVTRDRVEEYGTEPLKLIYRNTFLEDFQQEFECAWVDESFAWISWDTIQKNQFHDITYWKADSVDEAMVMLRKIRQAMLDGDIEPVLYGGLDIGRVRDRTELILVGKDSLKDIMPIRVMITLDGVPFEEQQAVFYNYLSNLNVRRCYVDKNGLGMQLAEYLQKTGRAIGFDFTNDSKEQLAITVRLAAEGGLTPIPVDRDLAYQIHSVKRSFTQSMKIKFDVERNNRHHADKFWAWAMAISLAERGSVDLSVYNQLNKVEDYESRWT